MRPTLERTETPGLTPAASLELSARLNDPSWLAALRARAAALAAHLPMPAPVERPWKYLDISQLSLDGYRPAVDAGDGPRDPAGFGAGLGDWAALLLQRNSETVFGESRSAITLADFAEAVGETGAVVERLLGAGVPPERSKLTALHYAFLRGGVLVNAGAEVEERRPVHIVRSLEAEGQLAAPHTLIVTGANSRVTVIEEYRSGEGDIVALPVVEIFPGPGAQVRYFALHRWGNGTRAFLEQRTVAEHDSALVSFALATGGSVVKSHLESSLVGRGASSELYGLALGSGSQHLDFYTLQDHIGPDTRSDLLFKSALYDRARAVYYGVTRVGNEARNADANQENRNLLLSGRAKADSDPVLEILTSNVIRASHGATAGPVDRDQLYYLETRGIAPKEAEALLVRGFLGEVLGRVQDVLLREALEALVEEKLEAIR
jgi:Fe-S cluster assembly protein SufD